uniref:Uncharacterized protein n=1 Tax=Tanacetum cinerariifolium TaxID=118510 RepID=A0A699IVL3_TANCI|nr:hypothetical protein [Tanacetum cinerariifolium]
MVHKQIEKDKVRQLAIMNLAVQFKNASIAKDDQRKAYEECNGIPQEKRALIDTVVKEESDKDCEMHNDLIIHDPAGILQAAKLRKTTEIREGSYDYEIPTQEYVREIVEDTSKDNHFTRGPWLSTVQYLAAEGGIIIVCFGDMKTFGRMGNLKNL